MKFRLFTFALFMIFTTIVSAQFSPVNWSYDAEKISETEYKLVFKAEIESGWFVYSQFLEEGGPVPTSFTFAESKGVEMLGKVDEAGTNKKEMFDKIFEMQLIKYGDEVTFTQKIKVDASIKTVKGYLTFMTCNDESCLPPKDVDFEIGLN